jgi:type IV secretion system protein VirD4
MNGRHGIPGSTVAKRPFRAHVAALLADPAECLVIDGSDLLALADPRFVNAVAGTVIGAAARQGDLIEALAGIATGHPLPAAGRFLFGRVRDQVALRRVAKLVLNLTVSRAALGLDERERSLLRGMAELYACGRIQWDVWRGFFTKLTWAEGKAQITPPDGNARDLGDAVRLLHEVSRAAFAPHAQFIQLTGMALARHADAATELGQMIDSLIHSGARWLAPDGVAASPTYTVARPPAALQLGAFQGTGQRLYFDGSESLVTIAGPGRGKTAGQVVPNLLTYRGSCFVLDVKDELWQQTAGQRARFGPVYRFAPTDPDGRSHRYNPFDAIPRDVIAANREAEIIASMIIPASAEEEARDPFWSTRARTYLWAFAVLVALRSRPQARNLASLTRLFTLPTHFTDQVEFLASPTRKVLDALRALADQVAMPALRNAADAFADSIANEKMLQSILDTGRSRLDPITRSPLALAAMSGSDWTPLDLRRRPGTTVYFCIKPADMRAYAPLIRLVFQQHVAQLTHNFAANKSDLPITFFIDEMPQLGYMPNLADIIELGRGAGVRLWMFMQFIGQLRDLYKAKADGLIHACQVRCFMSPDREASEAIEPILGKVENIFTGEKRPLATAHELAGRAFANDVVMLASGEDPARLAKTPYYKDPALEAASRIPPPDVITAPPARRRA